MRILYLLRHAKSSWDDPDLADHDRPLNSRGLRAARAMGRYIEREGLHFDRVFCSSARRARRTCDLGLANTDIETEVFRDLYMATPREMLEIVRRNAGTDTQVLLVGHNPGMENLTGMLCGDGDPGLLEQARQKYPTAALAEIELDVDSWADVRRGSGHLRRFVRPKDLPEADEERL